MIWLATSRGLTRYNPANGETARFPAQRQRPGNFEYQLRARDTRNERRHILGGYERERGYF